MARAGIDTSTYPGDDVMDTLRASTNLVCCGFYLGPAPSHSGRSWMDKRARLLDGGWELQPIYVGQQESGPGSHDVSASQGTADGNDACALAKTAGFPPGTVLYLDIETGGPLSAEARDYLLAWCQQVVDGGYVPGAYCSHTSAVSARAARPDLKIWVFKVKTTDVGVSKATPFPVQEPNESGVTDAVGWQWAQNCRISAGATTILVDLDVFADASADDSQPAVGARLGLEDPWSASPPPDADQLVADLDPRVDATHVIHVLPCPPNPPPPVGWKYWSGSVPQDAVAFAVSMQEDARTFPMGTFAQRRMDGEVVGFRVEWHDTRGATGEKGCFRGVNLMRQTTGLSA